MTPRFADWLQERADQAGSSLEEVAAEAARQGGFTRYGTPEEVAGLVAFLLSPEGEWLQGSIIDMDGGMTKAV
jgi:3-oxoacyl-[acyl-carrier protein] reductase